MRSAETSPGRPAPESRRGFTRRLFNRGAVATGTLAAAEAVAGPLLRVARAQEGESQLLTAIQATSPEPAATTTIALFTPDNPGQFPLIPKDSYQQDQPSREMSGHIAVHGSLSLRFSLAVNDSRATVENPVTGFVISNGSTGAPGEKRLFVGSQGPNAWTIGSMIGIGYVNPDDKRPTVELWRTLKQGEKPITGVDISPDGTSVVAFYADGSKETLSFPDGDSLYFYDRKLKLRFQTPPGGLLTVPNFTLSGDFTDLTAPPPPEPPPIIERPPAPIEPLFGKMPREVIGDLANDGFTVFNMGTKIRFDVKDIEIVKKAFRSGTLAYGREVQIALYDSPNDMPAIANPGQPISIGMHIPGPGCMIGIFDTPLHFYDIAVHAGHRVLIGFAPAEPLENTRRVRETGQTVTVREAYTRIFSHKIAERPRHTDPNPRTGVGCQLFTPEEHAIVENALFEIQPVEPTRSLFP